MDSPQRISVSTQQPQSLSPSNSTRRRRTNSASNSPDFEFWMVRNPSFPQPNLLSADQLFAGGVLRPLQHIHLQNPDPDLEPEPAGPGPEISPASITAKISPASITAEISPASITATAESAPTLTASKRWKDLFKKGDKKASRTEKKQEENNNNNKLEKERKREKKSQGGASSSAELNINIWPFSRSRSAGNSVTRPKFFPGAPGARKVSSAPCSRSNSAGESKSRKWPSSPGRPGVHLGRSSPVWQVRRGSGGNSVSSGSKTNNNPLLEPSSSRSGEKGVSKKEVTETRHSKRISNCSSNNINNSGEAASRSARVLNLNVPTCIGYRHHLSCRSGENSAVGIGGGKHGGHGGGGTGTINNSGINVGGGNIFNFRSLFTKKVY